MEFITKKQLLNTDPKLINRPYQLDVLLSIFKHSKCLVKMFCGTGKSCIITNIIIHENKELSVIVFPSLALINQYYVDYLNNSEYKEYFIKYKKINISSENIDNIESTTDKNIIKKFLKNKHPKIILVTYQSYQTLLEQLQNKSIGIVCYDEAHHVVSPICKELVFDNNLKVNFEKQVFFTATPRNENGITMFDREDPELNMCGEIVYDYSYLQGLNDKVLNHFDICVDMYTDNNNQSIYEAIARAILTRGTSRVLTFHAGVNGDSETEFKNFVNKKIFISALYKIQQTEFPKKKIIIQKLLLKVCMEQLVQKIV